jgi:hypothetical protein
MAQHVVLLCVRHDIGPLTWSHRVVDANFLHQYAFLDAAVANQRHLVDGPDVHGFALHFVVLNLHQFLQLTGFIADRYGWHLVLFGRKELI